MRVISSVFTLLSRSAVMALALSYSMTQLSLADSMYLTNGGQSFSFVSEFTTSGTYLGQFTNSLNNPAGIAQDPSGNYYVVNAGGLPWNPDPGNSTVVKFLAARRGIAISAHEGLYGQLPPSLRGSAARWSASRQLIPAS